MRWLIFGNVFGDPFNFGYGPFGAPNGGPAFSAIVTGQGGPPQGLQQLSIYNDYNCCGPGVDDRGHFNDPSDLVQSNVFQEENPITAALIAEGVFEFSFDAKAGDISGSSTAIAFIRTLDPNAGFALTNDITVDTTNLAPDWERLTLSIDLSDPLLEGQILQFGFATEASNFEPSNNFYDNLEFCPAP